MAVRLFFDHSLLAGHLSCHELWNSSSAGPRSGDGDLMRFSSLQIRMHPPLPVPVRDLACSLDHDRKNGSSFQRFLHEAADERSSSSDRNLSRAAPVFLLCRSLLVSNRYSRIHINPALKKSRTCDVSSIRLC